MILMTVWMGVKLAADLVYQGNFFKFAMVQWRCPIVLIVQVGSYKNSWKQSWCIMTYGNKRNMTHLVFLQVLPYFHVYRGAEGKVAEFSCSVAKVQRLR